MSTIARICFQCDAHSFFAQWDRRSFLRWFRVIVLGHGFGRFDCIDKGTKSKGVYLRYVYILQNDIINQLLL